MSRKLIGAGTLVLLVFALASPLAQAARYGPLTSIDPAPTFTPSPNPGPAPTVFPEPESSTLIVQLRFQGRPKAPDNMLALPVSFILQLSGAYGVGGDAHTDANGIFTVDVSKFTNGKYTLWVKSPKYLANATSVLLNGDSNIPADGGTLLAGDANDDNVVNGIDVSILKNTFNKSSGDKGYDGRADFDGNKIVDKYDRDLLLGNYGEAGAVPPK
jgi:hypothetical protein